MTSELDRALVEDFPLLFADRNKPIRESNFSFGFECGAGWEPLIRRGAEKLEKLIREEAARQLKLTGQTALWGHCRASQVKEKYGTLRFYMTSETDEMSKIIEEMEEESGSICETCGAPGRIRGKHWYYTACEEHAKEGDTDAL